MARTFELSTRMKAVQRSEGRSATAAAAYRACCEIECEREGRTHNYSRKGGLEASEIHAPAGAPKWAADRAKLWNGAELVERNGKRGKNAGAFKADARTAREIFWSFPVELSAAGRLNVARAVARHLVEAHEVAADFSIHKPGREGDERNFHCHLMFTTRQMTAKGLGAKTREWDDLKTGPALTKALRAFIAKTLNDELAAEGKAELVHVEHQSFKERGSAEIATHHQGPAKTHTFRKDKRQARDAWTKAQRQAQREAQAKDLAALKMRQDFALQGKMAELIRRGRDGEAAIARELAEARAADTGPTGMRRLFLIVTGREGREAFARQARDAERVQAAAAKLDALKAELKAERVAFMESQARERGALIERHGRDDRQLAQAVHHRAAMDRVAEVSARRDAARAFAHERQQHERGGRGRGLDGPTMH